MRSTYRSSVLICLSVLLLALYPKPSSANHSNLGNLSSSSALPYFVQQNNSKHFSDISALSPRVSIPIAMTCAPVIRVPHIPTYGTSEDLQGQIEDCIVRSNHRIAVYIYVNGWWTKPSFANPITTIQSDGSWTADITTGGTDQLATEIIAFVIPKDYNPPVMSGEKTLPEELFTSTIGFVSLIR